MLEDDKQEFQRITSDIHAKAKRMIQYAIDCNQYELAAMFMTIHNVSHEIVKLLDKETGK